jgi:glycosidase
MGADPSLFVFGHLATPEHLAGEARRHLAGLYHGGRIEPRDPQPGQPVGVLVEVGSDAAVDRVWVRYALDGTAPDRTAPIAEARRVETRWDDLAWAYVDRWLAELPAQPEGTAVRYLVYGRKDGSAETMAADGAPGRDPELFGFGVDRLSSPCWVEDAVIYQIFVDRFWDDRSDFGRPLTRGDEVYGGSLDGVRERLGYLSELGITALWLTPIFAAETYHRYDALDYERVDEQLGGNEALASLVRAAHGRGIRILLDLAASHCSWHHPWFVDAQRNPNSQYRSWFTFRRWPDTYATFFGVPLLPKINTHNPEVAEYFSGMASRYLTEVGVDGFRLDHAIGPPLVFWSAFRTATKATRADSYTVGEVTLGPGGLRQFEGRLDGCLDFPLLQAFRRFFVHGGMDAQAFHSFLAHQERFYQPGFTHPSFLDNHDMDRFLWAAEGDVRKLELAAACQFSLPQPPIIYYGTEVGLSQKVGAGSPFGFEACRLPMLWEGQQDRELLAFYRTLIDTRKRHPALRRGSRHLLRAEGGVYAYTCRTDDDQVTVALNNSAERQAVSLPGVDGTDVLSGASVRGAVSLAPLQAAMIT